LWQDWQYDGRGRVLRAGQALSGVGLAVNTTCDSADRPQTMRYGDNTSTDELVTYQYDASGRPTRLSSSLGGDYVSSATYTALDQPATRTIGTEIQTWDYTSTLARLDRIRVGISGNLGSLFNRSYGYDPVGNITSISDSLLSQTQTMGYDHRDRLTSWTLTGQATQSYSYNQIGNLTSKAGVSYSYPSAGSARPHTPSSVGGQAYSYDLNGNLTSGGGRTYVWNGENQPGSVTSGGATETYQYDGDGSRVSRTVGGVTTLYGLGAYEYNGGVTTKLISFNGQIIARRNGTSQPTFLYGDHLGSISATSTGSGSFSQSQRFDPWGKVIAGGVSATSLNYTGQRQDGTGLLYYNARSYDPRWALHLGGQRRSWCHSSHCQ
jgi:YD repeat-containing protein